MTALAPALQAYFTDRLITQHSSSPETIAAYRDAFRLLLRFAHEQTGKQPFQLDIDDLDAPLPGAFLKHLEEDRGNSPRTRNARLGAIHSFGSPRWRDRKSTRLNSSHANISYAVFS